MRAAKLGVHTEHDPLTPMDIKPSSNTLKAIGSKVG